MGQFSGYTDYTSTFVSLTPYCLVEYRYSNPENPNSFSDDFIRVVNTNTIGLQQTTEIQVLNVDSAQDDTQNVQVNSCIQTTPNTYTSLDPDEIPDYLVYSGLTNSVISGTPVTDTPYDSILWWFLTGYNFEGLDGAILKVEATEQTGNTLVLASIAFLSSSDFFQLAPQPMYLGGRLYNR